MSIETSDIVPSKDVPQKLERLQSILRDKGTLAVAVSGGVDSMTLAHIAHGVNPRSVMFHALSPAVPGSATRRVKDYADRYQWNLQLINADEINDPKYVENPANRCYFCKTNLYDTIAAQTTLPVVSGTNLDDLGDYRPGLEAASEHDVTHPWVEAEISKDQLRAIAGYLQLEDLQDLPAAPCLSSRVTTGIAIDPNLLPVIDEAEEKLWLELQLLMPLKGVRCRIRPSEVAIELDTPVTLDPSADYILSARETVRSLFVERGFEDAVDIVSVEPYKRGSAFLIETLNVE